MEVKIISGYGENTFQMDDADTMSLLNNAMRFHNKIKAIGGVKDNTGTKADKEEEVKKNIAAQEFVKKIQEKLHSRNDSLFGAGWKKEPQKTEKPLIIGHPDGYKGFLYIKCDKCGKEKGFYSKEKIKSYKCECGKETELENLKPLYTKCKCGNEFKHMTNMNTAEFTYKCFNCGSPVDVKMNSRRTAYTTIGGGAVLKVITANWLENMVHQLVAGRKELNDIYVL